MKHLLDVNLLIAAIWNTHVHHARVRAWLSGKEIALCPICELGFIRISTNPKTMQVPMERARELLAKFRAERGAEMIADDLDVLGSHPKKSLEVTDQYLADLAAKHHFKLATLDGDLKHAAAELVV
jgi:toxin-antitoxin system PIN domain toxin